MTARPHPAPPCPGDKPAPEPVETGRVTITAARLADSVPPTIIMPRMTLAIAERLLGVASRMVLDYAPKAPTVMLNEAVIRFAGYLLQSDFGEVRSATVGPMSIEYNTNHAAAFRNSGAAMLLTRYKVRRAGHIG